MAVSGETSLFPQTKRKQANRTFKETSIFKEVGSGFAWEQVERAFSGDSLLSSCLAFAKNCLELRGKLPLIHAADPSRLFFPHLCNTKGEIFSPEFSKS